MGISFYRLDADLLSNITEQELARAGLIILSTAEDGIEVVCRDDEAVTYALLLNGRFTGSASS